MREVSPAENLNAEEYYNVLPDETKNIVEKIRREKKDGKRILPSASLIDKSEILNLEKRKIILDEVAKLVDENIFGRSEMCIQFAELLAMALKYLGHDARLVFGKAIYFNKTKEVFRWDHAWVRVGEEVIDANQDSLWENPKVLKGLDSVPYWGKIKEMPKSWRLQENGNVEYKPDSDVANIWWPDLLILLDRIKSK